MNLFWHITLSTVSLVYIAWFLFLNHIHFPSFRLCAPSAVGRMDNVRNDCGRLSELDESGAHGLATETSLLHCSLAGHESESTAACLSNGLPIHQALARILSVACILPSVGSDSRL
jgi:hypothetical protein